MKFLIKLLISSKGIDGLYAKMYILITYFASMLICAFSYHEIYRVTIRQSKRKRALNSSSLRLHDEQAADRVEQQERVKNTRRRTPREIKRNNKIQRSSHFSIGVPSRTTSMRY